MGELCTVNERDLINKGLLKKCSKCAEFIKSEATVCRYCGHKMLSKKPEDLRNEVLAKAILAFEKQWNTEKKLRKERKERKQAFKQAFKHKSFWLANPWVAGSIICTVIILLIIVEKYIR